MGQEWVQPAKSTHPTSSWAEDDASPGPTAQSLIAHGKAGPAKAGDAETGVRSILEMVFESC